MKENLQFDPKRHELSGVRDTKQILSLKKGIKSRISVIEHRQNWDIKVGNVRSGRTMTDLIILERAKLNVIQEFTDRSKEEINVSLYEKNQSFEKKLSAFLSPCNLYGPRFDQSEPIYERLKELNDQRLKLGQLNAEIAILEWLNGKEYVDTELIFR